MRQMICSSAVNADNDLIRIGVSQTGVHYSLKQMLSTLHKKNQKIILLFVCLFFLPALYPLMAGEIFNFVTNSGMSTTVTKELADVGSYSGQFLALPPVAVCKDITVYLGTDGNVTINASDIDGGSYDPDGIIANIVASPASFNCSNIGPNNVTLTVTDNTGMVSTCVAVVTVRDNLPPVMACKNLVVYLDQSGFANITAADINNGTTDNCEGPIRLYINRTVFSCSDIGAPVDVTLTGTDASGNTASCVSQITVRDTISPVISLKTFELVLNTDGTGTLHPSDIDNGTSDNCGPVSLSVTPSSFNCGDQGIKTVVLTAVDSHGNSKSESVKITVRPWFEIESMSLDNCDLALPFGLYKADITGEADSLFSYFWDGLEDLYKPFLTFIPVPPYLVSSNTSTLERPFFNNADLPDGTYTIRLIVKDNIGCVDTSEMVIRKEGPLLNNITSVYTEACEGATAIYTVNSDSGAIYSWSIENGLLLTADPDTNRVEVQWNLGVSQGVVKTTITRHNIAGDPCISYVVDTVTIHPVQLPEFNSPVFTACADQEYTYTLTGTFKSHFWNITGGRIISGGKQNDNFVRVIWGNNPSGRISVNVQNNFNCSASVFIDVNINNLSGTVSSLTNISCNGASDGKVTVEATSGSGLAPYTYSLDGGPFVESGSFSGISLGNHIVTIRDANFCNYDVPFLITQPPIPLTAIALVENVKCFGAATGSINLTVAGGTPPYTYLWNNDATTKDLSNVPAGVYTVTVTDANLCTVTASATVSQPLAALEASATATDVKCFGEATGSVDLTVTGGTAPYTYSWSNGATTEDLVNIVAGTYTVTVTDANLCTVTASATVSQPSAALDVSATVTDVKCFGESTGEVDLTVTGGTAPYTYSWSNDATTEDLVNIVAGVYTVTVTDANLCTAITTVAVSQPESALSGTTSVTDVGCFGESTGEVDLTVTGGTASYTYLWSNGAMTQDLVNVPAGSYTVTITDANLCTTQAFATVSQPSAALDASATATDVKCFGESTGAVDLTVTGGTAPYTYLWSNGATTEDLVNIVAGTYTVTVTDANLCTVTASATVAQPSAALDVFATVTDVKCFGESTGEVDLTVTGGTAPYTYSWSNDATTEDLVNIVAGTYTVTIVDANFCLAITTVTVSQPESALSGTTSVTDVGCFGESTGEVDLTVTGGTEPYTYLWSNGAMTQDLVNVPAGSYTVTITDGNLCTTQASATVSQPSAALDASATATDVKCFGESTGAVDLTVTGGTAPYTYLWSNGATTEDLVNIVAGTYTVTVTDANLCTVTASATVSQPSAALDVSATVTDVKCFGESTGEVDLTVTGGTAPYTYSWSNGATTKDLVNIVAGVYTVTVTDANLCTAITTVAVAQPESALSGTTSVTDVGCFGESTGEVDLTVTGGTAPYTYLWSNGAMTQDLVNVPAGSYTVTITDGNLCTTQASATVSQPSAALDASATATDVKCFGEATGSVDLTVTGGTAPYTYLWSNGATTEDLVNIVAGTYTVTVTDANLCTVTASATVSQPSAALDVSAIATDVKCFGESTGEVDLTVTGGTAPYTYSWSNDATTEDLVNIVAGTYTVTVTDANLCTAITTVTVSQPESALSGTTSVTDVGCFGESTGEVDLTVTGGTEPYTYLWSNGAMTQDLVNVPAGSYTVTITDGNLCTTQASATVSQPSAALDASATATDVKCFGEATGSVDLTVTGGTAPYTYLWSNGATTEDLVNIVAGTYTVTVTDANLCTVTASATVSQPSAALDVSATVTDVKCFGESTGEVDLTVTGGTAPYTYSWSNGATTEDLVNIVAGVYTVTVTDANLCTATVPVTVSQPSELIAVAGSNGPVCIGMTLNLQGGPDGMLSYSWNGPDGFTSSLQNPVVATAATQAMSGQYTLNIVDMNGCSATANTNVVVNEIPVITFTQTNILCNGTSTGAIDITVSGGTAPFVYLWTGPVADPATGDQINIPAGTYTVIVTDANNCTSAQVSTEITELPPLLGTITSRTNVTEPGGNDGSFTVEGSGGTAPYMYSLESGPMQASGSFSTLTAGTYTVTVYDANLCEHFIIVIITEPNMPLSGQIISQTDVLCYGDATGSVTVIGIAGEEHYEYSIDGGAYQSSGTFGSLTAGTHIVTIQDAALNTFDIDVLISQPALPLDIILTQSDNICSGANAGSATAIAAGGTGPYTYSWNTTPVQTGPDATELSAGTYTVTVTDANGCIATGDVTIAEPDPLSVTIIKNDVLCNGDENGSATVNVQGGTGPYIYSWNTIPVQTTPTINGLAPGAYSVTVTDANGCTATVIVDIIEPAVLTVTATVVDAMCPDTNEGEIELNIIGGIQPYTISWSDHGGFTTQTRTDLYPGTYSVVVSDANGCRASTSVDVGYTGSYGCLIIPDIITPNGDGHNDEWIIRNIDMYPEAEVFIYSRWGRLVYRTKNISENPWNGQYRGSEDLMPTDSYHYILHLNDGSKPRSGVISVIR
ncbi:MAG: gliding motility-associated C-terminal domain-containing protein [Bacteroidales bacterium]|jgi:gliding motility-associated-like protein